MLGQVRLLEVGRFDSKLLTSWTVTSGVFGISGTSSSLNGVVWAVMVGISDKTKNLSLTILLYVSSFLETRLTKSQTGFYPTLPNFSISLKFYFRILYSFSSANADKRPLIVMKIFTGREMLFFYEHGEFLSNLNLVGRGFCYFCGL